MKTTGGEALVKSLEAHAVDTVFGIPGTHNLAAYDALINAIDIKHITARHEQGAAFMADGYARASGKEGICFCTSGPAALNAIASLGTSYADSVPVLCVISQIPTDFIGKEKGIIHECRDQLACFEPVVKWSATAKTVEEISAHVAEAFYQMRNGRPRPVVLEIPCNILDASAEVEIAEERSVETATPSSEQLSQAVQLLTQAETPIIWAGGGVNSSGASEELVKLAESLNAPVFTTVLGKGAIDDDHPLSAGTNICHPAWQEFVAQSDLMLAVGSRFTQEDTDSWSFKPPATLIHVDIDDAEMGRNYGATLGIVADARETVCGVNTLLASRERIANPDRSADITAARQGVLDACEAIAPIGIELVHALNAGLPEDTILVSDLTLAAYWSRRLVGVHHPRSNLYPWGFCTLGYGLSAAIGAKQAMPDRSVVCLSGDGGFLFNCQELAAAVQFELPVVLIVFNNNCYGVLKPQQDSRYGRSIGAELVNPDFLKLAESFGVTANRVDDLQELPSAIKSAVAANQVTLIEVTADIPLPIMESGMRDLHATLA